MSAFLIISLIVAIFLIIGFLESSLEKNSDSGGGWQSTIVVAGFLVAYWLLGGNKTLTNLFFYTIDNVFTVILYALAYIAIGGGWSIARWYFFVSFKSEQALERLKNYNSAYDNGTFIIPTAASNKYRIMTWMVYWPFSAAWTLINQPVRNTFRFVYIKLEGVYNSISDRMFAGFNEKFEAKKQEILKLEKEAEEKREKARQERNK